MKNEVQMNSVWLTRQMSYCGWRGDLWGQASSQSERWTCSFWLRVRVNTVLWTDPLYYVVAGYSLKLKNESIRYHFLNVPRSLRIYRCVRQGFLKIPITSNIFVSDLEGQKWWLKVKFSKCTYKADNVQVRLTRLPKHTDNN